MNYHEEILRQFGLFLTEESKRGVDTLVLGLDAAINKARNLIKPPKTNTAQKRIEKGHGEALRQYRLLLRGEKNRDVNNLINALDEVLTSALSENPSLVQTGNFPQSEVDILETPERYLIAYDSHEDSYQQSVLKKANIGKALRVFLRHPNEELTLYELRKLMRSSPPPVSRNTLDVLCRKLSYSQTHRLEKVSRPTMLSKAYSYILRTG